MTAEANADWLSLFAYPQLVCNSIWEASIDCFSLPVHPQARVGHALTNFKSRVSPWPKPSEWLQSNTTHIRSSIQDIPVGVLARNHHFDTVMLQQQPMIYEVCQYTFRVSNT